MTVMTQEEAEEFDRLAQLVLENAEPPTFAYLAVNSINVDAEYQRDLNQDRVNKMVREYDPHRLQPLDVSHRSDGTYWCMEGQHRLAMARLRNMHVVGCMVHEGLSSTDEALLFWKFQRDRTALPMWASFRSRLHGHEPIASDTDVVAREVGLTYGRGQNYDIQALGVMEAVVRMGGKDLLRNTLNVIKETWPSGSRRFDGGILSGVALILNQYSKTPEFSRERFVLVLSGVTPSSIVAELRMGSNGVGLNRERRDYGAAIIMRTLYNRRIGLRRQLPPLVSSRGRTVPNQK